MKRGDAVMNKKNDFDFVFEHLEDFDENITLPDSLKSENLMNLIEDIEPIAAASPAETNKIHFFNKRNFAIAAMFVVAIGITIFYRSGHLNVGSDQMKMESAPSPVESPAATKEYAANIQSAENGSDNAVMEESADFEMPESSVEMMEPKIAFQEDEGAIDDWAINGNVLVFGAEEIYSFPEDFEYSDSYSEGELLIINGTLASTNQSVITVFKIEESGKPNFVESITNQGKTIYTMVYGDLTIIVSTENEESFVNTYNGAKQLNSTEIEQSLKTSDILDSTSGFAIKLSDTTALIFDNEGNLMRDIEIEEGLNFENIIVEGNEAFIFLDNQETLTVPLT